MIIVRAFTTVAILCLTSSLIIGDALETPYDAGVTAYKKKDYAEALSQWTQSASRGDLDALNNLGYLLYNGLGTGKDLDGAIRLWRTAAFAGHSEAQWHLGTAYETGQGVPKNLVKAYAWYRCSMESATHRLTGEKADIEADILSDGRKSLASLMPKLSGQDLERGSALAVETIARYGQPAP